MRRTRLRLYDIAQDLAFRSAELVGPNKAFSPPLWPTRPSFTEELASEFGLQTSLSELDVRFQEEVGKIDAYLREKRDYDSMDWREQLDHGLWIRAEAMTIWEAIGTTLIVRDGTAFRLFAPASIVGTVIAKAMPVDMYIGWLNQRIAREYRIARWLKFGLAILGVVCLLCAFVAANSWQMILPGI